ncbi:MAG TPA: glutathione S-transferase N-terminal domain-containing protein [Rhodoblastus sp.]|nr:glutathione S-transferase N-terminal domain-containing protein [Rhodoblastus sp.]
MIELFYWPTPNGHKITIFLEEAGLPYEIRTIDIGAGEQFQPDFLKIAPNNRMPAIIDRAPADGGAPISIFESGAILQYLAEKTGKLLPSAPREKYAVLQWLYWQMGGLGPMAGQNHHFAVYAPEKIPYAIERYVKETNRLYGVLDRQLARTRDSGGFIAGALSIADMACYPWIVPWKNQSQNLDDFPNLRRWFDAIRARPAVQRAYEIGDRIRPPAPMTEEAKKVLFGQTAASTSR